MASSTATDATETADEPTAVSRPHPLGDRKGAGQQLIELGIHRSHGARRGIGLLHLAENLRLAHHHGIQARGHAEHMTNGVLFAIFVKMGINHGAFHLEILAQKTPQIGAAVLAPRHEFHAIAGAKNQAFLHSRVPREAP